MDLNRLLNAISMILSSRGYGQVAVTARPKTEEEKKATENVRKSA